jgi:hypothetical protein
MGGAQARERFVEFHPALRQRDDRLQMQFELAFGDGAIDRRRDALRIRAGRIDDGRDGRRARRRRARGHCGRHGIGRRRAAEFGVVMRDGDRKLLHQRAEHFDFNRRLFDARPRFARDPLLDAVHAVVERRQMRAAALEPAGQRQDGVFQPRRLRPSRPLLHEKPGQAGGGQTDDQRRRWRGFEQMGRAAAGQRGDQRDGSDKHGRGAHGDGVWHDAVRPARISGC